MSEATATNAPEATAPAAPAAPVQAKTDGEAREPYATGPMLAMRNTWAITRKELSIYFSTPIAYSLMAMFLLILGFFFVVSVLNYIMWSAQAQAISQYQPQALDQLNFTDLIFSPVMGNAGVVLLFIVPFLTMRLIAEEKRQQTFQLLMTSPISAWEITLGKYLATMILMFILIGMTSAYPAMLDMVAEGGPGVEWQTVWVTYLGLFLFSSAFMSIGLFVSSLTESQVVAAAVTFGIGLLMWVLSWAGNVAEGMAKDVLQYVSLLTHMQPFLKGLLNLSDLMYFVSLTILSLFLTRTAIERTRW